MPLFMDRHNVEAATSAELAEAHERDLAVQSEHGVRILTYWFDPRDGTAVCLVDAPDPESLVAVHRAAHGNVPADIIEVDLDEVNAFLGRVSDPAPQRLDSGEVVPGAVDSALRAIVFTDLQDSTSLLHHLGHHKAIEALETHDRIVTDEVKAHGGTVVKNTGDGFLLSFASVDRSVACAVQLQRRFAEHNDAHPESPLHIRVGINAGVPVERSGDLFGSVVQLAARICAHAQPDQIAVAGVLAGLCSSDDLLARFTDLGRVTLKGFVSAVHLYAVQWQDHAPSASPERT